MPVQPTYPGVYVQEEASGVRTIVGVSTSTTLFIARAAWGPVEVPVLCLSYTDFERNFTSFSTVGDLARSVKLFFLNGGTRCYILRIKNASDPPVQTVKNIDTKMDVTAIYPGAIGNDIVVDISHPDPLATTFDMRIYLKGADEIERGIEEWREISMNNAHPRFVETYVRSNWISCNSTDNTRPAIGTYRIGTGAATAGTNGMTPRAEDYLNAYTIADKEIDLFNLLVLPKDANLAMETTSGANNDMIELWSDASGFCEKRRAFLLLDPPNNWNGNNVGAIQSTLADLKTGLVTDHSAIYFPNVKINDEGIEVFVSPAGAIAGLMTRIDTSRGVWKAPAGVEASLRGIRGLDYRLTDQENGVLNPLGINVLRAFPNGIVCWGARTMEGDDDSASEWKYIPVRRTASFIEQSLERGLKWVVFEPNDERLWGQIRLNVGAFMHNLFMQGAFQGLKKSEAYFVKCDSETTTQNDINLGIVNILVGFAPLKPAEFVILKLQQMSGQVNV